MERVRFAYEIRGLMDGDRLIRLLLTDTAEAFRAEQSAYAEGEHASLVGIASDHGLAPLLYHRCREAGETDRCHKSVMEALRSQYLLTNVTNEKLLAAVEEIRKLGLPVVCMKGIALLPMLYADSSLRPMSDVDLITGRDDFPHVIKALKEAGFHEMRIREGKVAAENSESSTEGWITLKKGKIIIDLHSQVPVEQEGKVIEGDYFLQHSRIYLYKGQSFRCPSPELMLTHLIIHLEKHLNKGVTRYSNLMDILLLIIKYRQDLDRDVLRQILNETSSIKLVNGWLDFLTDRYDLPFIMVDPGEHKQAERKSIYNTWMRDGHRYVRPVIPPWQRSVYQQLNTAGKKRRYILSVFFPSFVYMRTYYGLKSKLAVILYYPWRIIKHSIRYFRRNFETGA